MPILSQKTCYHNLLARIMSFCLHFHPNLKGKKNTWKISNSACIDLSLHIYPERQWSRKISVPLFTTTLQFVSWSEKPWACWVTLFLIQYDGSFRPTIESISPLGKHQGHRCVRSPLCDIIKRNNRERDNWNCASTTGMFPLLIDTCSFCLRVSLADGICTRK